MTPMGSATRMLIKQMTKRTLGADIETSCEKAQTEL